MATRPKIRSATALLPLVLGAVLVAVVASPVAPAKKPTQTEEPTPVAPPSLTLATVTLPPPPPLPSPAAAAPVRATPEPARPPAPAKAEPPPVVPLKPSPPAKTAAVEPLRPPPTPPKAAPEIEAQPETDAQDGRVALRFLEHGQGPAIELAWPDTATARVALYDHLTRCLGMKTVLMNREGLIFDDRSGPAGSPPDLDAYSGFVRQVEGLQPPKEAKTIGELRRLHAGQPGLMAVRLFPRTQDAVLLGGLRRLVGEAYAQARHVRARYGLDGRTLTVFDLTVEGQRRTGVIRLPTTACRG